MAEFIHSPANHSFTHSCIHSPSICQESSGCYAPGLGIVSEAMRERLGILSVCMPLDTAASKTLGCRRPWEPGGFRGTGRSLMCTLLAGRVSSAGRFVQKAEVKV